MNSQIEFHRNSCNIYIVKEKTLKPERSQNMANNSITYLGHTVLIREEGLIVLDSNSSVMGVAMDMEEVHDIILRH